MTRRLPVAAALLALVAFAPTLLAQTDAAPATPKTEKLPRDERNTYVTLDNGFKIIVRPNQEPPGRVDLNLHVKTGSLNETTAQNGLAHFLEHMAFNGSKNFGPGELIPRLDELGMQFGADTNAHTTYHETVYKLSMPNVEGETIDIAMTIFSDYAYGLLLLEEEIEKERGIIASEKTSRKGVQQRIREKLFDVIFAGTRFNDHDIIGTDEVISAAPRSEFVDYYNTWYRPDNMTLIVVGDVDPTAIVEKARGMFSAEKFPARAEKREAKSGGILPTTESRAAIIRDRELPIANIQFLALNEGRPPMTTFAEFRANEIENLGPWIVNRRLDDRKQRGEASYFQAGCGVQGLFGEAILPSVTAVGQPADWKTTLGQVISEIDRAIEHGFTTSELDLAKKETLALAKQAVETANTRSNGMLVGMLSSLTGLDQPILSEAQQYALLERVFATVTVEEVQASFRNNFSRDNFVYVLALPESAEAPTEEAIVTAAKEAWGATTEEIAEKGEAKPILEALPKPGEIVSSSMHEPTGVTTLQLSNGATVHHKYMDERANVVQISIQFPGGVIEETAATRGVADVASLVGATSRLSSTEIRDAMTGKTVNVGGGFSGADTCQLVVTGAPNELADGLQLLHAYLLDGKIEPTTFGPWKEAQLSEMKVQDRQAGTHVSRALAKTFYGGDPRFTPMTEAQLEALSIEKAEKWGDRILGRPIEIAIVGDWKLEDARPLIEQYLATLPKEKVEGDPLAELRKLSYEPGPHTSEIEFETDTDQALVYVGYRGAKRDDQKARRCLQIASAVLTNRMIDVIREEKQLVYSIGCSYQHGDAIDGTSQIFAAGPCQPGNSTALADEIERMLKEFAENGPTDEELTIVRGQFANRIAQAKAVPATWLRWLSDLEYRGRSLDDIASLETIYESFTKDDLHQAVKSCVSDERKVRIIAKPKLVDAN